MSRRLAALVLLGVVGPAAAQDAVPEGEGIGVTVSNVVVWAAVNDRRGRPETDLEAGDFKVLEDGKLQKIANFETGAQTPLAVQILVDASKSMDIAGLLDSAGRGIRHLLGQLRKGDEASLWFFAGRKTYHDCPMGTPPERIADSVAVLRGFGETRVRDSIRESLTAPFGSAMSRKAVFIFTDGKDNASEASDEDLAILAGSLNVPIHAIILASRPERDLDPSEHRPLQHIVELSGGTSVITTPFDDEDLLESLDTALGRLRSSYLLEYSPEGAFRRGFRRIEVRTTCKRCTVLHRQGYYAR